MNLIFSNLGRLLSQPTEEREEEHDGCSISVKYYQTSKGWYFSVSIKFKNLIKIKPVKQTDKPLGSLIDAKVSACQQVNSWITAPTYKKILSNFVLFDFKQLEFDFNL